MAAPRVLAKGEGTMAQRIREIATAAGVPVVERKPLARALYRCGDHKGLGESVLRSYAKDLRGHYATHAKAILREARR